MTFLLSAHHMLLVRNRDFIKNLRSFITHLQQQQQQSKDQVFDSLDNSNRKKYTLTVRGTTILSRTTQWIDKITTTSGTCYDYVNIERERRQKCTTIECKLVQFNSCNKSYFYRFDVRFDRVFSIGIMY